jgi:N-acyl-D-amino-acid deacylase
MVPHGALRAYVLGEGRGNGEASGEEISLMAKYAREAVEAGAVGLSTTRTVAHTDKEGQPAAGSFASAAELIAIGDALGGAGRRVFSVVSDHTFGADPGTEFAWMAEISRRNRIPVTYMVVDVPIGQDTWHDAIARGIEANRQGAWLVPQVAGKPASLMVGWESNYHLFSGHAAYEPLADLPHEEKMARLHNPEVRRALLEETPSISNVFVAIITAQLLTGNLYPLGDPPDYEPAPADSVLAIAEREGRPPLEVAYDLMLRRDGHELLYTPLLGYTQRNLDALREMLTHPATVLGLSDGGAHVGFICDGSMPTFMLTHWARDRHRGETIPLELAVQLQTSRTAELFGFEDRGVLEPGRLADINVIDFDHLTLGSVEMSYDLPAQGKRLTQRGRGYTATVKSGVVVRDHDEPTGERPGALLRGPQPA